MGTESCYQTAFEGMVAVGWQPGQPVVVARATTYQTWDGGDTEVRTVYYVARPEDVWPTDVEREFSSLTSALDWLIAQPGWDEDALQAVVSEYTWGGSLPTPKGPCES